MIKGLEMAQLAKYFLRKREGLSLYSLNLYKKLSTVACSYDASSGEVDPLTS